MYLTKYALLLETEHIGRYVAPLYHTLSDRNVSIVPHYNMTVDYFSLYIFWMMYNVLVKSNTVYMTWFTAVVDVYHYRTFLSSLENMFYGRS